jgi:hypothetical protein
VPVQQSEDIDDYYYGLLPAPVAAGLACRNKNWDVLLI